MKLKLWWLRLQYILHVVHCDDCTYFRRCKRRQDIRDRYRELLPVTAQAPVPAVLGTPIKLEAPPPPRRHESWPAPTMHLLSISDARILRVPLAAYTASPARFTEIVTARQMKELEDWVAPRLEVDLVSINEMELEDPHWEVWLIAPHQNLVLLSAFELVGSTLIVTPSDLVRAEFQQMAEMAAFYPTFGGLTARVLLNSSPIKGSDAPVRIVDLDVNALSQEADCTPEGERKRIVAAFGEHVYISDPPSGTGKWYKTCGKPEPLQKGRIK